MSCPDCYRGGVTTEHPKGEEKTIHGRPTYVAQPPRGTTPRGIILFLPDAFGWRFPNNRVLADHYASRGGYLVYLPDFMDGHAVPAHGLAVMDKVLAPAATWADTLLWKPWYAAQMVPLMLDFVWHCRQVGRKGVVFDFVRKLRSSSAPLRIGVAGFCWGGKLGTWLAQDEPRGRRSRPPPPPLVDCVFTAHPSFMSVPADYEAVSLPLSVAIGDTDMAMPAGKIRLMKETLEGRDDAGGRYEVSIIPGAKHGFAVRSHPDDEHEMACALRAEDQALAWFDKWLARD
ncbi:dienelactone hydrolase family protein [Microdochium trichocladiopsis]|uniref:Dienelactone hydrolase family protein n=1 Tax=Microdochium trichocladiopsis TaxID=1682393 RepID=A0A9P8YK64_9PEZI|nr:dienelactone hydrolase family protein [Microdochium trichocladiopsis]KAH7041452.1 dienelactone hydrolase family protein [Microdochium trichocladiopsis]